MGISLDNWHKLLKMGGKRKPYLTKQKYELGRPAVNTRIGPFCIYTVHVWGGNKKHQAVRLDVGNFLGSECCACKTRITKVVYKASNKELVCTKTTVKNGTVLPGSTPRHSAVSPTVHCPWATRSGPR